MNFSSSLSGDHFQRYFRIVQEGLTVRRHIDLLRWLQGEVQHYLPHEIMLAAWGDFDSNAACYDIVSSLPGVRTAQSERSEEHTSELQSPKDLVCRLLLEKKK